MRGLEWFSLLVGSTGAFLAAVLALLTIVRRYHGWNEKVVKGAIREALIESGLTKNGTLQSVWPNGSDNLPDFLEHLWQSTKTLHDEINKEHT